MAHTASCISYQRNSFLGEYRKPIAVVLVASRLQPGTELPHAKGLTARRHLPWSRCPCGVLASAWDMAWTVHLFAFGKVVLFLFFRSTEGEKGGLFE